MRNDAAKLGLVIEGGGMRGVVTAGMVCSLEQLGLRDAFDAVYGASGGAINGAYFVAGQAAYGTTIYYQEINNNNFLDLRRLMGPKPAMSLEFLLDEVCRNRKPLAWDKVVHSPIRFVAVASSVSRLHSVPLTAFRDRDELREALRASARIPVFAGEPVPFRGDRYLDATFTEPVPYRTAIEDGCSHLLVLLSHARGAVRRTSLLDRVVFARWLKRFPPEFGLAYLVDRSVGVDELELLARSAGPPHVLTVAAAIGTPSVSRIEKSPRALVAGAAAGARAVLRDVFDADAEVVEALRIFLPVKSAAP